MGGREIKVGIENLCKKWLHGEGGGRQQHFLACAASAAFVASEANYQFLP